MVKISILIGFGVCFLTLLFSYLATFRTENVLRIYVRRILIPAMIAVGANFFAFATTNYYISIFFYSVFSGAISWICFFLTDFTHAYCKNFKEIFFVKTGVFVSCVYDSITMLINGLSSNRIIFDLEKIDFRSTTVFVISANPLYVLHLVICYLPMLIVFTAFAHKSFSGPVLYRKKYFYIFMTIIGAIIFDVIYLATAIPYDISVLIYGIAGSAICYFSLFYSPVDIEQKLLSLILGNDSDAIICFDRDDEFVFLNKKGHEYYNLENATEYEKKKLFHERILKFKAENGHLLENANELQWMEKIEKENDFVYYEKFYKQIYDERNIYLGSYVITQDITKRQKDLLIQHYNATHDKLTGLYNREYFFEKTRELLNSQPNRKFAIVVSDIKDFKLVNDVFGPGAGDKVLRQIADCIRIEAKESTVYARYQGDRFCLCMPLDRFSGPSFVNLVNRAMSVRGNDIYHMDIYLGIYKITEPEISVTTMCDRAFLALDSIKGDYNKNFAVFTDDLMLKARKEHEKATLLSDSIKNDQFTIFLQPQINSDGKCLGGEALVRWFDPERGMVMPGEFIGIFERTGAISVLDRYIWELACKQLQKWKAKGFTDYHISVNISPKDFYFTDIYSTFTSLVQKYDIEPKNLKLEITESSIMIDIESQKKLIRKLQKYGFIIEMDDFGSGYSSLNMLKDINVDVLKVDMAFLGKTENKERSETILKAVLMMAKSLNMQVVTEGVETEEQVNFLKEIGCDVFQGHFFSQPIPVYTFEEKYFGRH